MVPSARSSLWDLSVPLQYEVTGGGVYCSGATSTPVQLEGSQEGIVYRLYRDGVFADRYQVGNGGTIDFGVQEQDGQYTIMASDLESGCERRMLSEAEVREVSPPEVEAGDHFTLFETNALVPLEGMLPEGGSWEGNGTSSIHINPQGSRFGGTLADLYLYR